MKKIKIFLTLIICISLFFGCIKPNDFANNYTNGAWVQYGNLESVKLNLSDLNNASFKATGVKVYGNPSKIEIYWNYNSKPYLVKTISNTDNQIVVTALELVKAVKKEATVANELSAFVVGGDQIALEYYIYDQNGNKILTESGNGLGGSSNYNNLNNNFKLSVVCTFKADEAIGNYKVLQDGWEDVSVGDVLVVSKINDSTLQVAGYPANADAGKELNIVISSDGTVKNCSGSQTYSSGSKYSISKGSGFVFSCAGKIDLSLDFLGATGTAYAGNKFRLQKQ